MAALAIHLVHLLALTLFVVAPLPLGLCVVLAAETETRRLSPPRALLVVLAVWCVTGAVVAHVLAVLHQLRFPSMVVAQLLVLVVGALWLARLRSRHRTPTWAERRESMARPGPLETVVLLALALMGLTLVWWSCAMPVVDWDSWAFHMPSMIGWLRSGTFTRMVQYAERPRSSYPYGWEALCTLFLTTFDEDVFVTLPNLAAWALLGVATYLLARFWRARRIHALACATLLLAFPCIADVVDTMHVDLPFAALFMAAAYLGAVYRRSGDGVSLGLAGATLGLACATRTTAPLYAIFLVAWLLVARLPAAAAAETRRSASARGVAVAGLAVGFLLAIFWYAKNTIELGHVLGSGAPHPGPVSKEGSWAYFATTTLAASVDPLSLASWKVLKDRAFHELDIPFLAIVLLAALWPASWLVGRARPRAGGGGSALALLVAGTLALFWLTPLGALSGVQIRLGMPFLATLAVAAAVGATRAGVRSEVSVGLALLGAAQTFAGSRVVYVLVAAAILWGAWPRDLRLYRGRVGVIAGTCALLLLVAAMTWAGRERRERERRDIYGPAYAYLEDHLDPSQPVAYLLSDRSYQFYGRRLMRAVVYAPLGDGDAVAEWAERLRRQGIGVVVVGPWGGDGARAELSRLTRPNGPLVAVSGSGEPGEVTVFRLDAGE